MLPVNTQDLLYREGTWALPGEDSTPCEGAKFHSPRPLFVQPTRLTLQQWDERLWTFAPMANLCGTCRDNLNILLQMFHHTDGDLPWEVRREFGNDLRALAQKGWEFYSSRRPAPATTSDH